MNARHLILNFVNQFSRPFDLGTVCALTNCKPKQVKAVLAELLAEGVIKLVDPQQNIFVRCNRFNFKVRYYRQRTWSFDLQDAIRLLDVIEQADYGSVREIGAAIGRSRQWVFVYLEALASIGCVAISGKHYVVVSRDRVRDVGQHIVPGILRSLRAQCEAEERARLERERENKRLIAQARREERERKAQLKLARQNQIRQRELAEQAKREAFLTEWNAYLNSGLIAYMSFEQFLTEKRNKH